MPADDLGLRDDTALGMIEQLFGLYSSGFTS